MSSVILLGGGSHSKQVIDIFRSTGIEIIGIYDDHKTGIWYGVPILGTIEKLDAKSVEKYKLFCCIGDNEVRRNLMYRFRDNNWTNCIDETAKISPSAKLGLNNYIGGMVEILADSSLGEGNIINEGTIITHDVIIGDFNHLAPRTTICGNVSIGNLNLLGTGSVIIPKVTIEDNNIFGASCMINKSVKSNGKYVGVPIRLLREN